MQLAQKLLALFDFSGEMHVGKISDKGELVTDLFDSMHYEEHET